MRSSCAASSDVRLAFLFVPLLFVGRALLAGGRRSAAERRVIVTPDADYPGFDYKTVKDVDLDACQAACLADNTCRAFTFNTKAGWCFLKSDFGALAADAGRDRRPRRRHRRPDADRWSGSGSAELDFLPQRARSTRRATLVGDLKRRYADDRRELRGAPRAPAATPTAPANYDQAAHVFRPGAGDRRRRRRRVARLSPSPASAATRTTIPTRRAAATDAGAGGDQRLSPRRDRRRPRRGAGAPRRRRSAKREIWRPAIRAYRASLALSDVATRARRPTTRSSPSTASASSPTRSRPTAPSRRSASVFSDTLPVARPGPRRLRDGRRRRGPRRRAAGSSRSASTASSTAAATSSALRAGLPAADGETLDHPVELDIYVRDRAPWVGFAGNAYVLPAGPGASIPIIVGQHRQGQGDDLPDRRPQHRRGGPRRHASSASSAATRADDIADRQRREGLGRRDRHPVRTQPDA